MSDKMRIGEWDVDPTSGQISRGDERVRLEARTMRLLMYLAERPGQVVSIDQLLKEVWAGVIVTSDSVYQAVAALRRTLGDDPKEPKYVATVPRLGYRMIAPIGAPLPAPPPRRRNANVLIALVVSIALALAVAYAFKPTATRSVAVVPFIDLTEGMSHEYFTDGMTEEVINKLSKVPNLRVAAPTSSFYLKNKPIAVTDIARRLGVAYVLDGSVRKSGTTLRIAARLSRGDNGYVVWSETYDRSLGDILAIQDTIAAEVAHAVGDR